MGFWGHALPWGSSMPAASRLRLSACPAMRVTARSLFAISVFTRLPQASRLLLLFFFPYQIMLKYGEEVQTFKHVRVWCKREGLLSSADLAKTVPLSVKTQMG